MSRPRKTRSKPSERCEPRYPELRVAVRSDNPLALVAAVRHKLRSAGARPDEISEFSDQALSGGLDRGLVYQVVEEWVGGVGVETGDDRSAAGRR